MVGIHGLLWQLYKAGGWHRMHRPTLGAWTNEEQAEILRRFRVVGRRYGFRVKSHRVDGQKGCIILSMVAKNPSQPPIGPEGLDAATECYALIGHDQAELCCLDIVCRCAAPRLGRPTPVELLPSASRLAEVDPFTALRLLGRP
jgi:hypothetical protein